MKFSISFDLKNKTHFVKVFWFYRSIITHIFINLLHHYNSFIDKVRDKLNTNKSLIIFFNIEYYLKSLSFIDVYMILSK